MHTYGEHSGVKFRINHDGPMSMETLQAIKKMVTLVSKSTPNNNGKRKTFN